MLFRETSGFIQAGYIDPENLLFIRERICEVREAAPKAHETINTLDEKCAEIFRGHPFYQAPDLRPMLRRLVARTQIGFNLGSGSPEDEPWPNVPGFRTDFDWLLGSFSRRTQVPMIK